MIGETYEKYIKKNGRREYIQAVDGVSMSLKKAERIGIIGASGCGKTTLLKMILGLLNSDKGTIVCNGRLGFVAQDPYSSLCLRFKVKKIVAEPLVYSKKDSADSRSMKKLSPYYGRSGWTRRALWSAILIS